MILLRMNLSGWFDLYISQRGSSLVDGYFPPYPDFVGRDGKVFVDRLVDVIPGGDRGRNRYLLYITDASMSDEKRQMFRERLLDSVGDEIETLMRSDNQVEAADLVDRVRVASERLEREMELEGRHSEVGRSSRHVAGDNDEGVRWNDRTRGPDLQGEADEVGTAASRLSSEQREGLPPRVDESVSGLGEDDDDNGSAGNQVSSGSANRTVGLVACGLLAVVVMGVQGVMIARLLSLEGTTRDSVTRIGALEAGLVEAGSASSDQMENLNNRVANAEKNIGALERSVDAENRKLTNRSQEVGELLAAVREAIKDIGKRVGTLEQLTKKIEQNPRAAVRRAVRVAVREGIKDIANRVGALEQLVESGKPSPTPAVLETIKVAVREAIKDVENRVEVLERLQSADEL